MNFSNLSICLAFLFLAACASKMDPRSVDMANNISNNLGCPDVKDKIFDALYKAATGQPDLPDSKQVQKVFAQKVADNKLSVRLSDEVANLYQLILDSTAKFNAQDIDSQSSSPKHNLVRSIAALELEDQSTPEIKALLEKFQIQLAVVQRVASEENASCTPSTTPIPGEGQQPTTPEPPTNTEQPIEQPQPSRTLLDEIKSTEPATIYGAFKVMGTAYQSCEAMKKTAMTSATPDAQGITITGTHPDGVGSRRYITNLSALLHTDYYLSDYRQPSPSCFAVQKSPLIYDYGGKPNTDDNDLNLFSNAGSGTSVLGIDCSAYVFSSLASAGLKVKSNVPLRPQHVEYYSSGNFKTPEDSGMDCLPAVQFTKSVSVRGGDIAAVNGHVLMVDNVGEDAFGLASIKSAKDCVAQNISYKKFQFDVMQSSNSKNGMGINRYRASDYLAESDKMRAGFEAYALEACKAKFGSTTTARNEYMTIVRHKDIPKCYDKEVKLRNQECISSCQL